MELPEVPGGEAQWVLSRGDDVRGAGVALLEHQVDSVVPRVDFAARDGLRDLVEVGLPDFVEGPVSEKQRQEVVEVGERFEYIDEDVYGEGVQVMG